LKDSLVYLCSLKINGEIDNLEINLMI